MRTTTIRVDRETHAQLRKISEATGCSLADTVRDAVEALRRVRFARQVQTELETLRENSEAWENYLGEAAVTSVVDGIT